MENKIFKSWIGYKLPLVHVKLNSGFRKMIADLIIHPIRRRVSKFYIYLLRKYGKITVVAITGSAGKTTTKEMISSVLKLDGKTVYSKANIDPVFNIPNTILSCDFNTKYLVLEFGVEYPNEMDFYLWLVKPDVGVITNIFPTHTLFFKDKNGVLKEKSKLAFKAKTVILNGSDKLLKSLKIPKGHRIYWFKNGNNLIQTNKNTAIEVLKALNISNKKIKIGLSSYEAQAHRMSVIKHKSGAIILDDTYNSNPEALIASIKYFNDLSKGRVKILIIGDMLELGKIEIPEHKRVGKFIKKNNFKKVFGVGSLVKYITPNIFTIDKLTPEIKKYLKPNHALMFKASRSIGLDRLVDKLI